MQLGSVKFLRVIIFSGWNCHFLVRGRRPLLKKKTLDTNKFPNHEELSSVIWCNFAERSYVSLCVVYFCFFFFLLSSFFSLSCVIVGSAMGLVVF